MTTPHKSGARLHSESTRLGANTSKSGFFSGGRLSDVQKFWGNVNKEEDEQLKCACGKKALFKVPVRGKRMPIGYCRKCKPGVNL